MCDESHEHNHSSVLRKLPVTEAVGTVLAHDITEIRPGEFKGRAFQKGHIIKEEDVCRLQRLGKEHLFVLNIAADEMHEDDAAATLSCALMGQGVNMQGAPKEGKINIIAETDGLLKIDKKALLAFNMLGDVMCATLHNNTLVTRGRQVASTRAIPLIVRQDVVRAAVGICEQAGGVIEVRELRKPKAGVVITGNEVFNGKVHDAFAPVITKKIKEFGGEIVDIYYAPDDEAFIVKKLRDLLNAGADLLITTGGMSVDPDDVTRFAIRKLGARDITYGSAMLPGAMFLVAYLRREHGAWDKGQGISDMLNSELQTTNSELIPILGIPACGMYAKTTVFDMLLPRILTNEKIGRNELAELGHGGLCLECDVCRYPICPFGK